MGWVHELMGDIVLDPQKMPRHVAVIMDGNGRWAQSRGLPRMLGHRAGMEAVRRTIQGCADLGVEALTLYAFSWENWQRPQQEITGLMGLLEEYIDHEMALLDRANIRVNVIGRFHELPVSVQSALTKAMEQTADNTGLVVNLALSYGSRQELVDATRAIAREVGEGLIQAEDITEETIEQYLTTAGMPDPDLLIRTSGQLRVSNFLLWQISYSEIYVTDALWPDFGTEELHTAIYDYQQRERRFGRVTTAR
jgi:undecaprenyl diphosphate synthase